MTFAFCRPPSPWTDGRQSEVIFCVAFPGAHSMPVTDAFDLKATLKRLDGDRGLFRELIGFFFEDCPMVFDQLQKSLADENLPAIERAAHSLKGLAANVGSGPASLLAARIEDSARQKDLKTATAALPELKREVARLRLALEDYCALPDPPAFSAGAD
jgi:HPt (histidine-containing phosphotransfer) domain-containing protein